MGLEFQGHSLPNKLMRSELEIQRAHDLLVGITLQEGPTANGKAKPVNIAIAASVLCWVLEHDHNPTFGDNLARLEKWVESQGFTLERHNN